MEPENKPEYLVSEWYGVHKAADRKEAFLTTVQDVPQARPVDGKVSLEPNGFVVVEKKKNALGRPYGEIVSHVQSLDKAQEKVDSLRKWEPLPDLSEVSMPELSKEERFDSHLSGLLKDWESNATDNASETRIFTQSKERADTVNHICQVKMQNQLAKENPQHPASSVCIDKERFFEGDRVRITESVSDIDAAFPGQFGTVTEVLPEHNAMHVYLDSGHLSLVLSDSTGIELGYAASVDDRTPSTEPAPEKAYVLHDEPGQITSPYNELISPSPRASCYIFQAGHTEPLAIDSEGRELSKEPAVSPKPEKQLNPTPQNKPQNQDVSTSPEHSHNHEL